MNYEEILARIQKGENPEAIVKEFTDNINKAQAEVTAAKEAEAKNEAKSKKLDEIAVTLAATLNEYAHVAGIDYDPMCGAEVRQMLDEFLPIIENLKGIKVHVAKADPKAIKAVKKFTKPEDVFAAFFKENDWF